ncbi:MAG: class I SAM-dependent methyltransferase, partial [Chloroflexota bacterium]
NAQLTLIDIAPAMLAQAQQRFEHLARPATFITADYVNTPIVGQFDLIVSALALHHTPEAQLIGVFANIYAALAAGGRFINIDQALGSTAANEARLEQTWRAQVRAKGATEVVLTAAIERMTLDRTATLLDQLRWLNEVGFVDVECWYRYYRFCVFSGDVVSRMGKPI